VIQTKRVYDPVEKNDGMRFLVERLWPRGLKKEALHLDAWLKEVAPSDQLRVWFGHDPLKWEEFKRKYWAELAKNPEALVPIRSAMLHKTVTLLYSAHDLEHNNAIALKQFLDHHSR
jgi:uncharacterized protein YeaO (DUF488 family)